MYAEYFGESVNAHPFLNRYFLLTTCTLIAAVYHFFSGEVVLETVVDVHLASELNCFPRNFDA
jgi:hypothetical protein